MARKTGTHISRKYHTRDRGSLPTAALNPPQAQENKSDQGSTGISESTSWGTRSTSDPSYPSSSQLTGSNTQAKVLKRRNSEALGSDGDSHPNRSLEPVVKKRAVGKDPAVNIWVAQTVEQHLECQKKSFQQDVASSWANQTPTKFRCSVPECEFTKAGQVGFEDNWHLKNHMISHSPDQPFGCRVCPKCSIRFKQEKDQKRHCMERCKHRGCCINGVCQLQTSTPQSAQNTPNTQTPQYSPNRQNRTSPPFSSYSQSPQQQTPYINRNVGLNPVDSQSQHIPQSVLSHFTGDAEAMKQQSPHFRPNPASGVPVVQSAPALSSNSALATVIQSEQSKELKLGEDRIAQEVHYRRLGQIEEDIYNPLLAFVTQVELNPASHLGNGSESTTWEVLSVDEIFSEWIESFDTN